jgi:hypothetical protein
MQETELKMKQLKYLAFVIAASFAVPGLSQPAQAPAITALALLQPGQWALRSRGDASETRSLCVRDPLALLQVRHTANACSRFVIANNARDTTVHYTCPGSGHGRTSIRVETSKLVQIQSQGIADNEPFSLQFEGRRIGECGGLTSSLPR